MLADAVYRGSLCASASVVLKVCCSGMLQMYPTSSPICRAVCTVFPTAGAPSQHGDACIRGIPVAACKHQVGIFAGCLQILSALTHKRLPCAKNWRCGLTELYKGRWGASFLHLEN